MRRSQDAGYDCEIVHNGRLGCDNEIEQGAAGKRRPLQAVGKQKSAWNAVGGMNI